MELSRSVQKVRIRIMNHHRIQKKEAKPVCEMKPDELLEFNSHVKSYYILKKFAPWMLYKRPSDDLF
jgi:hypothetical protein